MAGKSDHKITYLKKNEVTAVNITAKAKAKEEIDDKVYNVEKLYNNLEETGLAPPLPDNPSISRGKAPVLVEPTGYATISFDNDALNEEKNEDSRINQSDPNAYAKSKEYKYQLTDEQFNKYAKDIKKTDSEYVAMTAYGAIPLPDELLDSLPEKFEKSHIIHEHQKFVPKQRVYNRIVDDEVIVKNHHFFNIPQAAIVNKIVPVLEDNICEIPKYKYKETKRNNIIELPAGINYVETPIDVHLKKPPKLVPVQEEIIIKRIIKMAKPVVKSKIVEVPVVVYNDVEHIIEKEVPFYVPNYVEKIIDINYKPGMKLPTPSGKIYTSIPDEKSIHEYIELMNQYEKSNVDKSLIFTEDGVECRISEIDNTILGKDGSPVLNADNKPIQLSELASPAMTTGNMNIYKEGDTINLTNVTDGQIYLTTSASDFKTIKFAEDVDIQIQMVEIDPDSCTKLIDTANLPEVTKKIIKSKPIHYIPPKLLQVDQTTAPQMHDTAHDFFSAGLLDGKKVTKNDIPTYIAEHKDGIYPVPLDPITRIDSPVIRAVNCHTDGNVKVLTKCGEINQDLVLLASCCQPEKILSPPFSKHKTSIPLDEEGHADYKKIQDIQQKYKEHKNVIGNPTMKGKSD